VNCVPAIVEIATAIARNMSVVNEATAIPFRGSVFEGGSGAVEKSLLAGVESLASRLSQSAA
jgi:hypothetical protein